MDMRHDGCMYIMYVDESGDSGLLNSPTSHFVLSGIVVHESRWRDFITALVDFRKTLKTVYGLSVRQEIHASEYINRRPINIDKHLRLAILRNCLDELAKINFLSITNIVVDKRGKPHDYNVFNSAWSTLFQRFENTMLHGNLPGGHRDDYGIVITDATAGRTLQQLVRKMAVYNPVPNDRRYGTGYRNIPIKKIIEDPYGKDSRESYPVQMADVVAYSLYQRFAPNSYFRKKRAQNLFDRTAPILNHHASRSNNLGIVTL